MTTTDNVESRVKQIIVEQLGVDAAEVTPRRTPSTIWEPTPSTPWSW